MEHIRDGFEKEHRQQKERPAMKHDAIKWAQGLIELLPPAHEGRNSWLLNHGEGEGADAIRKRWERRNNRELPHGDGFAATNCGVPLINS